MSLKPNHAGKDVEVAGELNCIPGDEVQVEWATLKMHRIRTGACDDEDHPKAAPLEGEHSAGAVSEEAFSGVGQAVAQNLSVQPASSQVNGGTEGGPPQHSRLMVGCSESQPSSPVTPTGSAFNTSTHKVNIVCMLVMMQPMTKDSLCQFLGEKFLKHKRCCSLFVMNKDGVDVWVPTEVHLEDHITEATIAAESEAQWEDRVEEYASGLSVAAPLDSARPLWHVHSLMWQHEGKSRGCVIFHAHHALGDGFSLMSLLVASLRRADDPSAQVSFPGQKPVLPSSSGGQQQQMQANSEVATTADTALGHSQGEGKPSSECDGPTSSIPRRWWSWLQLAIARCFFFTVLLVNTLVDSLYSALTLLALGDSDTPLKGTRESQWAYKLVRRSEEISLDDIRVIRQGCRARHGGPLPTVNDVLLAAVSAGTHRYLAAVSFGQGQISDNRTDQNRGEEGPKEDCCKENGPQEAGLGIKGVPSTTPVEAGQPTAKEAVAKRLCSRLKRIRVRAQVLMNLRGMQFGTRVSNVETFRLGNHVSTMIIGLPVQKLDDPLERVRAMKAICDRGKASWSPWIFHSLMLSIVKCLGKDVAADTLVKLGLRMTFAISNVTGPAQKAAWQGNVISSIIPSTLGNVHGVTIHFISYDGKIRFVVNADEHCLPDPKLFVSYMTDSLKEMKAAALSSSGMPATCTR
ncbi:hypothetical protein CBR_g40803 [Chara braunii]|uniref:Uncharacterized protein n=1 Tax=Chara braunii TaxID=69332 RepID=A0A388LUQ8_CHABU|nr:hypothetical protein CBR_g40803 [Chara braunii]|eukprot:GBG85991.1 hypothetical protein CBR_g40803 [Chara braunii]